MSSIIRTVFFLGAASILPLIVAGCADAVTGRGGSGGGGGSGGQVVDDALCNRLEGCNALGGISASECTDLTNFCLEENLPTQSLKDDWALLVEDCQEFSTCGVFVDCVLDVADATGCPPFGTGGSGGEGGAGGAGGGAGGAGGAGNGGGAGGTGGAGNGGGVGGSGGLAFACGGDRFINPGAARSTAGISCEVEPFIPILIEATLAVTPSPSFDQIEIQVGLVLSPETVDGILDLGLPNSVEYASLGASGEVDVLNLGQLPVSLWEEPVPCQLFLERGLPSSVVLPSLVLGTSGATSGNVILQDIMGEGALGAAGFVISNCMWDDEPPIVECNVEVGCFLP